MDRTEKPDSRNAEIPATRFPAACTIVSRNYLSDARVLAASYLQHHPGAHFYTLVIDGLPGGVQVGAGIHVIRTEELELPFLPELYFKCNATELCITVKPALMSLLLRRYNERDVIYFDSDILVMRRLDELLDVLKAANIVLTPHLLRPIPLDGKRPNEQDILIAGSCNLGFIAVRRSEVTGEFLRWWQDRMRDGCFIQFSGGLLTDQRWVDLAPSLFGATALRDETYNVAYWNLHSRPVERKGTSFLVNGRPISFFHFSGFNPNEPTVLSEHQNRIEVEKGGGLSDLLEVYVRLQKENGFDTVRKWQYGFGHFDNGAAIAAPMRHLYVHLEEARRRAFGDPFSTAGNESFYSWATRPNPECSGTSPFLSSIHQLREDVAAAFPDIAGKDRDAFLEWAATEGAAELRYDPVAMRVDDCRLSQLPLPATGNLKRLSTTESRPPSGCSIIIPVFNNAPLTRACLDSIFSSASIGGAYEVIVVNDASTDATSQVLDSYRSRIHVVSHDVNTGFARSCNDAARVATGSYLIFLNNDTIGQSGWLDALLEYADNHPEAAIVGSKLLFPNQTVQHAGMVICEDGEPRHLYNGFPADHALVNRSRRFQAVTGACMLVRREDFDAARGFDSAFRNGYEDVDLCLRLGNMGRETHYCHDSVLYHLEAVSRDVKADDRYNRAVFFSRWAHKLHPDELHFYAQDELLKIEYKPLYPVTFSVSPLLAAIGGSDREFHVDRLLESRSQQVLGLLKDTIRLSMKVQEVELHSKVRRDGHTAQVGADGVPMEPPREIWAGQIHCLSKHPSHRLVSIILPVKNGASKLRNLLPAILSQETDDPIEIIAVDSASTDESVQLLTEAGAKVIGIDPRSFNHGLTRNLATSYARGSFFVFLNQSTVPADAHWLANLLRPFASNPSLAGVCGRMLPRQDADLLTARETGLNINARTERIVTQITDWDQYRSLDAGHRRLFVNFHSLSAAVRADVFRSIPFRGINFAEDLMWGREVLEAGHAIQYEPAAVAYHSHNYSFLDTFRRNFDDGIACAKIVAMESPELDVASAIAHLVRQDWRFLEEECRLEAGELEQWRLSSAMRRSAQMLGHWLGVNFERRSGELLPLLSITEQIKAGAKTESPEGWGACHANAAG